MKKGLMLIALVAAPALLMGWGTPDGTVITNGQPDDGNNIADRYGEVVAMYTNAANVTNYSDLSAVTTTTVQMGYDLSTLVDPADQGNPPGGFVDYVFDLTNRANGSDSIGVQVLSNGTIDAAWLGNVYEIRTNNNNGVAVGPTNNAMWTTPALAADGAYQIWVRVYVPAGVADGSTNEIVVRITNTVGSAGDVWPTAEAIGPATADLGDVRDDQQLTVVTRCQGPVITLAKMVNFTQRRPYERLTLGITYTNTGGANAMGVVIDDVIPNNTREMANTPEVGNTYHAGSATITYYDGGGWQPSNWDEVANNNELVERIRWALDTDVAPTQGGYLDYEVLIE